MRAYLGNKDVDPIDVNADSMGTATTFTNACSIGGNTRVYECTVPESTAIIETTAQHCVNAPNIDIDIDWRPFLNIPILGAELNVDVDGRGADTQFRVEVYVNGDNVGGGIISRDNVTLFGEVPVGSIVPNAQRQQINLRSNNPNNGHYGVSENYNLTVHMGEHQRQTCGSPNQFASMQLANYCPASVTSALYPNWRLFNPTSEYKPDDIILDIEVDYDAIETLANGNILYDVNITLTNNTQDNYGETAVPSVVVSDLITVNGNPVDLESVVIDESAGWVVSNEESPVESILDSDTGEIQFGIPSIDNDTSGQLIFQIELPPGMITNHDIQITSVNQQIPPVGDQNYASATIIVPTQADLELNVSGLQENEYIAGTIYTPVITVNNSGPEIAKDIQVTIQLSQGMQITDNPLPDDLAASESSVGRYVWSVGDIAVDMNVELSLNLTHDFTVIDGVPITNPSDFTAWISSSDSFDSDSQPSVEFPVGVARQDDEYETPIFVRNRIDCGVIISTGNLRVRTLPSTDGDIIGRIPENVWRNFRPIAHQPGWYLIEFYPGGIPADENDRFYNATVGWVSDNSNDVDVTGCITGQAFVPEKYYEIDLSRQRNNSLLTAMPEFTQQDTLTQVSSADSTIPDPLEMWSPLSVCSVNSPYYSSYGELDRFESIRRRCTYESYVWLWNLQYESDDLTMADVVAISIIGEQDSEFNGMTADQYDDSYRQQHLTEAFGRLLAQTCAQKIEGSTATAITCNIQGIIDFAALQKPWIDGPINNNFEEFTCNLNANGFGNCYTDYSDLAEFIVNNGDWATGSVDGRPFIWGNHEYKYYNSPTTVENLTVTVGESVATQQPENVQLDDIVGSGFAVRPGTPALPYQGPNSNTIFYGRVETYQREEGDVTLTCIRTFEITKVRPSGYASLGTRCELPES